MEHNQVLTIATDIGYMLLKHGGEVYRAEQSARLICQAYGVGQVDVFAIPTCLVVTVAQDDQCITKTRRILSTDVDLAKVERLNSLSREICETRPDYGYIIKCIQQVKAIKPYSVPLRILANGIISMSFAILYGSNGLEGCIALVIGLVESVAQLKLERRRCNNFIKIALCSFIISAMTFGSTFLFVQPINTQSILAGALMILLPGLALTNCMRDFMTGDFVAGTTKLSEALVTALAIALGVAMVLLPLYG